MLADDLRAASELKRNRGNLEKIQALLEVTENLDEKVIQVIEEVSAIRSAMDTLAELDEDNHLPLPWLAAFRQEMADILDRAPLDEVDFPGLIADAQEKADECEELMDSREYGKQTKDEAWGELLDAVLAIAGVLSPGEEDAG